jgi:Zn-dependent peptidase ImmA (M78 family)
MPTINEILEHKAKLREDFKQRLKDKEPAELHAQRLRTPEERARRAIDIMTVHQKEYIERTERREVTDAEARAKITEVARRNSRV